MSVAEGLVPAIKQESDQDSEDDVCSKSLLPLPPMPDSNFVTDDDSNNEFLRLTAMVREVYFSHLYKSLISNYIICCNTKGQFTSQPDLKKCAGQMELYAVRASLEASLYRQAMLKMISDVKAQTSLKRVHKKLRYFLSEPPSTIDVEVQTDEVLPTDKKLMPDTTSRLVKDSHVQNSSVTSNYDESIAPVPPSEKRKCSLDERVSVMLKTEADDSDDETVIKTEKDVDEIFQSDVTESNLELKSDDPLKSIEDFACLRTKDATQTFNDVHEIFGDDNTADVDAVHHDDNCSQDSILQHMEDMFCESNDSSDLMTLIEKHTGVSKANVDLEIGKMCPETSPQKTVKTPIPKRKNTTEECSEVHANKRKLSFSNYKKMKKRAKGESTSCKIEETAEEIKKRKASGVWFIERIYQVSKLSAKMTEISAVNYRKHGRIKLKFLELFGEVDEEETMPDSPICIEDHVNACKERIAPWVVKYLMPFYKRKRIADRVLFKTVAKHVADMLFIEKTFPEEVDVSNYIQKFFKNKQVIKTKPDIYM